MQRNWATRTGRGTTPNDPLHNHSTYITKGKALSQEEPIIRNTIHPMPHLPITTILYLWICQGPGPLLLFDPEEDHHEEHTVIWRRP